MLGAINLEKCTSHYVFHVELKSSEKRNEFVQCWQTTNNLVDVESVTKCPDHFNCARVVIFGFDEPSSRRKVEMLLESTELWKKD